MLTIEELASAIRVSTRHESAHNLHTPEGRRMKHEVSTLSGALLDAPIDTADHVYHAPSGEAWVVAYVRGDRLAWCGWPEGEAALADCTLVKKAAPAERDKLLREMATSNMNDARAVTARRRIAAMAEAPAAPGVPR